MERTSLTRSVKNLLYQAGVIRLARSSAGRSAPVVRVLAYHSVSPAADYCIHDIRVTPPSFERQVALNSIYIRRWRVRFELSILLRTIPVVLSGRGAY